MFRKQLTGIQSIAKHNRLNIKSLSLIIGILLLSYYEGFTQIKFNFTLEGKQIKTNDPTTPYTFTCADHITLRALDFNNAKGYICPSITLKLNRVASAGIADSIFFYNSSTQVSSQAIKPGMQIRLQYLDPKMKYLFKVNSNQSATYNYEYFISGDSLTTTSGNYTYSGPGKEKMMDTIKMKGIATFSELTNKGILPNNTGESELYPSEVGAGTYTIKYDWNNEGTGIKYSNSTTQTIIITKATVDVDTLAAPICKDSRTQLNATITGGNGSYFYSWTPNSGLNDPATSTPYATPSKTTTYKLTLTENVPVRSTTTNQCYSSDSVKVTVLDRPKIDLIKTISTNPACFGSNTGKVVINFSGGASPFKYQALPIPGTLKDYSSNTIDSLKSGRYTFFVKDANSCLDTTTRTLTDPTELKITSVTKTDITCNGGTDGSITFTAEGGTGQLSYSVNGTDFIPSNIPTVVFNTLKAGTYTVYVKDSKDCQKTSSITLTEPSPISLESIEVTHISECNNNPLGKINITAKGGTGNIKYSKNGLDFQASGLFIGLSAGKYTITMRDDRSCKKPKDTTIIESIPPKIENVQSKNVTCFGQDDGTMTITSSGGIPPYLYSTDETNYNSNVNKLKAGDYPLSVKDNTGCIVQYDKTIKITEPTELKSNPAKNDIDSCYGLTTGWIKANSTGGTGTLNYSLTGSDNLTYSATVDQFSNLKSGNYKLIIEDQNKCKLDTSISIAEKVQKLTLSNFDTTKLLNCFGDSTNISLTANGGNGNYQYSVDGGKSFSNNNSFNNLKSGTYPIEIQDKKGCKLDSTLKINQPDEINLSLNKSDITTFYGDSTGRIAANVTGGSGGFEYFMNGKTNNSDSVFSGLKAGKYIIKVNDKNGCSKSDTTIITEPNPIQFSVTKEDLSCLGDNTGKIIINLIRIVAPVKFSIDNGATFQDTTLFDSLTVGNYVIYLIDTLGHSNTSDTISINPFTTPKYEKKTPYAVTGCKGDSTGSVKIKALGGTVPYVYIMNDKTEYTNDSITGLKAGTYQLKIRDKYECLSENESVSITEPSELVISTTTEDVKTCYGDPSGNITINASGGTPSYRYSIDGGKTYKDNGQFNVTSASYFPTIIDSSKCITKGDSVTITQPEKINILDITPNDLKCFGDINGEITVNASGGTAPLIYTLIGDATLNNNTINLFEGLKSGNYQSIVTDANNCSDTSEIAVIEEPSPLELVYALPAPTSCSLALDGSIEIRAKGGTSPYSFAINDSLSTTNDKDTTSYRNLAPGTYAVIIKDKNNCTQSDTVNVEMTDKTCLEIATVFTPNGDGKNDTWKLKDIDLYPNATIQIFDSWGKLLVKLKANDPGWDGKYNGKNLPMDTYWYIIKLNDGKTQTMTGYITLMR